MGLHKNDFKGIKSYCHKFGIGSFNFFSTISIFDGAFSSGSCDYGMVLRISENNLFNLCMGCGNANDTKAELVAFWGLLDFALINIIISF